MEEIHNSQINKALELAKNAYALGDYPVGSILYIDWDTVVEWQNRVVTQKDATWHSEIDIIKKAELYQWKEFRKVLFVTLEPCNNCAKALCEYGIDEVYYILEDPSWGWKEILQNFWIQVHQIKYRYEEYLYLIIEFMQKHWGYNEVLNQYISIQTNGKNTYKEQLNKIIFDTFIDIPRDLPDYNVRKVVYTNTLSYLKNALLRTPEDNHDLVFRGYRGDMERIIHFCQEYLKSDSFELRGVFIKQLHKTLYPEWYIQKSKDSRWREFIWMIPGEYRDIDIISNDNANKNIYLKPRNINRWMQKIIWEYNENTTDAQTKILCFLADFSIVHPFWDGNGRLVYILTDLLLLQNNLPPFYFWEKKENDKVWFYRILDAVHETRDIALLYDFISKYST